MRFLILIFISFTFYACDDDVVIPGIDSKVTAKQNIESVTTAAKSGFAPDAGLSGIYGRNVSITGEVDLLNVNSLNAFVYIMQSDSSDSNEFYVPVYASAPVKSPVNFNTMLSFIKDENATNTVGGALGHLSTVRIGQNALFGDSPEALSAITGRADVAQFRSVHPDSKIDMFLFPSKAIDPENGFSNTADWVVNFYSDTASLVLWLNTQTGIVTVLSN
jgi:hypothetical protein